jgi:hypothetical protein
MRVLENENGNAVGSEIENAIGNGIEDAVGNGIEDANAKRQHNGVQDAKVLVEYGGGG